MKPPKYSAELHPSQPIGIFDSGVGGLTVARAIKKMLPSENFIYYGDTKHLPYGEKSREAIAGYSSRITEFLLKKNCKAIVIACNSATANALEEVKDIAALRVPVIDVISPVAEKVAFELHSSVGVIATKATVSSGIYRKAIRRHNKHIKVEELATPLLVPAIEEGLTNHPISQAIVYHYLSNKKFSDIETLILGCTHYPLVLEEIRKYYGSRVRIIDSPTIVANQLKQILSDQNLLNRQKDTPEYHFYVSDITKNFSRIARNIFGKNLRLELQEL